MRCTVTSLLVGLLIASAGCGYGQWGTVAGTVHLDDRPLEKGIVTFHPDEGGPAAIGQVKDGSFTLMTGTQEGLSLGNYKVTVLDQIVPKMDSDEPAQLLTPAKYASPLTSDLTATIKPGPNPIHLVLKK